ncbi:MAG: outer membrane protein assembly factor BamB family protein [Planctomycetota bacterium]|jgi:outer membrane protein assembly factor BamB
MTLRKRTCVFVRVAALFAIVAGLASGRYGQSVRAATPTEEARQILDVAGTQGGLIVKLGCGNGDLAVALGSGDGVLVHALDTDPRAVAEARDRVRRAGCYGKVAVDTFNGRTLPYVDNLVSLLIAEAPGDVRGDEVMRVLAPNGVACTKEDGKWKTTVKPWPPGIDEWTHYLHDATGNPVAEDEVVGPPRHVQWTGTPEYLRHHDHMSGLSAMVSAKGRLFYVIDLGPRWSVQMPPKWTLIARDAFNGVVLWQREIDKWHAHLWPLKKGPGDLMRRLVAEGESVYVTLGVGEPVTALDAATGRTLRTYETTRGAEEIISAGGTLFVLVNPRLDAYKALPRDSVEATRAAGRSWNWDEEPRRLTAVEAATGRLLWSRESTVAPVTLASADRRVYFHDGDAVRCLDAATGKPIWSSQPIPRWKPMHVLFGPGLIVHDDVVLFAGGEQMDPLRGGRDTMTALSAQTGKTLWTAPHPPSGYASAEDLLVVDGLVWCGETTNRRDSGVFTGRDLHTGEVVCEFPPDDWQPHMPHHRCYRAKATCNYILTSRTGIEFVDVRARHWQAHHWVRGSCNYGILPANGLVYAPPHSCACYLLAKLNGFQALAPASPSREVRDVGSEDRLQRGPAFGSRGAKARRSPPARDGPSSDWPTYRGNPARSGSTGAVVSVKLRHAWSAEVGGRLSSPVVADGRALVAAIDRHTIHAIDADSGNKLWSFTAGGRVDSPPTVWQGNVLFGSADGHVYCLRSEDGALAWRFRAAPQDRRLTAREQIESAWPVHGSVLVREGVVYCTAGRSMWLDGGVRFLRLDARTGHVLSETVLDDKYPGTDDNLQEDIQWPNLPVALADVLSCDGRHVYMRSQPFNLDGARTDVITPRDHREQRGETAHLFCPTGFLDDSWWHRTYWMYGRSFVGGAGGWHLAPLQAPAGRILVVDGDSVYGFGRAPMRFTGTPITHHLFACPKEPNLIGRDQPPRRQTLVTRGKIVPTRLQYDWSEALPVLVRAMVATDQALFVAGPPVEADEREVYAQYGDPEVQARMAEHVAAFEGRKGARLVAVAKNDGSKLAAYRLESAPVFDGLAAADGRLFLSTLDGTLVCLGPGDGRPLDEAPDVEPGPVPPATLPFAETKSHPDFDQLTSIRIAASDLGYRMHSGTREGSFALRQLPAPLSKRIELRARIRPRPGAPTPDTPGNAFLVFGNEPTDRQLVKCGFRISGQRLYIVQGPLVDGKSKSAPVDVRANEVAELRVVVDLGQQKIAATMNDRTVEAPLERRLETVTWIGCCVATVEADFSPIDVAGE